jgi:hypothetical protein
MNPSRGRRALELALYGLPVAIVIGVGFGWFLARSEPTFLAAIVHGARTNDSIAVRAELVSVESGDGVERRSPASALCILRVLDEQGVEVLALHGAGNSFGIAEFNAPLPTAAASSASLRIELASRAQPGEPAVQEPVLASGELPSSLPARDGAVAKWPARPRRGGWLEGTIAGSLTLRAGLVHGVLAVPFTGELRVVVTDGRTPIVGVTVSAQAEGATLGPHPPTDASGVTAIPIVPQSHVVEVSLEAASEQLRGTWFGLLPVVPGALHADVNGRTLRVQSPIDRSIAYVNVVSERGTLAALSVPLMANKAFAGAVELPEHVSLTALRGAFAFTSSEPDMRSMAAVGWPLEANRVESTFEIPFETSINGVQQAHRRRAEEQRRMRRGAAGVALLGALFEIGLFWGLASRPPIDQASRGANEPPLGTASRARGVWVATTCLVLGLIAMVSFGLL